MRSPPDCSVAFFLHPPTEHGCARVLPFESEVVHAAFVPFVRTCAPRRRLQSFYYQCECAAEQNFSGEHNKINNRQPPVVKSISEKFTLGNIFRSFGQLFTKMITYSVHLEIVCSIKNTLFLKIIFSVSSCNF
jgi:hypothetical protein